MADKKKYSHAGQPTKYRDHHCQDLIDFFDQEPWEDIVTGQEFDTDGEVTKTHTKRVGRKLPSLVDFAKHISCGIRTVYEWVDPDSGSYQEEFSQTYRNVAKKLQKWVLSQGALLGAYNPGFAKFLAVNISDMRDKNETDVNATFKGKVEVSFVEPKGG